MPSPFADWIEQLSAEAITGGCGGGNYCPLNANTRGQMAVFITKTFHLQWPEIRRAPRAGAVFVSNEPSRRGGQDAPRREPSL